MNSTATERSADRLAILFAGIGVLVMVLYLHSAVGGVQHLTFLIGVGLGITLLHAAFGFTGGWRLFIRDRDSSGIRAQILLLALTSLLFFPLLGDVFIDIQVGAALAPVGTSVIVGAFLFGIGMQLGGGCGSGTLYTVGQGQLDMLITLLFFIVGATLGSAHLHWWLSLPAYESVWLMDYFDWWQSLLMQLFVLVLIYGWVRFLELKHQGEVKGLEWSVAKGTLAQRLVRGPWPLWWGVLGLAVLNLATMLVAGHPWSITYAFGLWGAKTWAALGGDPGNWEYWSFGYPAQSLDSSVLEDTTSVMNFGIILGAVLAAGLAGKYAPAAELPLKRILIAVAGGLLLGYGARLGFGCNIGALVAGISSGSLHGWVWLIAGFCGSALGVYLRIWLRIDEPIEKRM